MNRTLLLTASLLLVTRLEAQPQRRPLPSGRATSEVTLAFPRDSAPPGAQPARIRLDYGQPHLRGRRLHTDSLVPYGKPWRTGANAATTLMTEVDITLGELRLEKGTYVLLSLPDPKGWMLIVQRNAGQMTSEHDPAHDIGRVRLTTTRLASPMESFTMWLIPATTLPVRGELRMAWGSEQHSVSWTMR
jgi:hypothetical protein